MTYTVIGGQGFIGSTIVELLKLKGHSVWVPQKGDGSIYEQDLGIVIYAAGHGDCNKNPLKVYDANLNYMVSIIDKAHFEKFIYISSTRVYMNQIESSESCDVKICAEDSRALFNLTKLTAENILLNKVQNSLVLRPSNVYGLALDSPLFLPSIVRDAVKNGAINMFVPPEYSKDYISVDSVANCIYELSKSQITHKIVNLASGTNVTAQEIADSIQRETNCKIIWHDVSPNEKFERIDISRIKNITASYKSNVINDIKYMINQYKEVIAQDD
jgi:nucleoside-diphosphate-sugar epimerase